MESVAAPRSEVAKGDMLRAITRTVLAVQAAASSPMKRAVEASAASARSPCRQPVTVTSSKLAAPGVTSGRS
jgi:anti-sigma factor RsiW